MTAEKLTKEVFEELAEAKEKIEDLVEALEEIAELLNGAIVSAAGTEAEWEPGPPFVGIDETKLYSLRGSDLIEVAKARESANSVLHWIDELKGY